MLITLQCSRNIRVKKDTKNVLLPIKRAETEQIASCAFFPGEDLLINGHDVTQICGEEIMNSVEMFITKNLI